MTEMEIRVGDSEGAEVTERKKKKKKKRREDEEIAVAREGEESGDKDLSKKKSKKRDKEKKLDSEAGDGVKKSKKKKIDFDGDGKKKKKKIEETKVDSEAEDGVKKSKKKLEKSKVDSEADDYVKKKKKDESDDDDEIGNSESSDALGAERKKGKRKRGECDLGDEENTDKSSKKKKKKASVGVEVEETSFKPSEDSEAEAKKEKKKKKKKKKQSNDSVAEETHLNSTEGEEDNNDSKKYAKKKSKKKKTSEDSEAKEKEKKKKTKKHSKDSTEDAKKKRKKKEKCKDVNTPSSKSTKRVKFADQLEVFPEEDEVELVRGKRFSEEEDALLKKSVLEYIDNHALGEDGLNMILKCKEHPQLKGCWKEIASALPWRPYQSVYYRAHTVFEAGSKGVWTKEDFELVKEFQRKHGNDWKTLADAMGKHRIHVKDAWRRIRLNMTKGHWSMEEYQTLFDLVNKEIRMKAYKEKHSKHGMLRDDIPWMAISDELGTRNHVYCCDKWYKQLSSPMVAEEKWAHVDDYRLMEELMKLDAACIDDVDWDNLLDNRDGDACRNRWYQMVRHIGSPGTETFAEQVEILSERYCPDLAEDREDFDNRPFDPED